MGEDAKKGWDGSRFSFTVSSGGAKQKVAIVPWPKPEYAAPGEIALNLKVQDAEGLPHRSRPFEIKAAGKSIKGMTTGDGIVKVKVPEAAEAHLSIDGASGPQVLRLKLGKLHPPETVRGAQQRLQSLGYQVRPSGDLDAPTTQALAAFRHDHGLPEGTGLDEKVSRDIHAAYRGK